MWVDLNFYVFKYVHEIFQPAYPAWTVALDFSFLRRKQTCYRFICCLVHYTNADIHPILDKYGLFFTCHAISACDYIRDIRDEFWFELLKCMYILVFRITRSAFLGTLVEWKFCYLDFDNQIWTGLWPEKAFIL